MSPKNKFCVLDARVLDIFARTLWGEARGEGARGMEAVASVILNRVRVSQAKKGFWWGNDIIAVCQKPFQFSCWNHDDPNLAKLLAVDTKDAAFVAAKDIAKRAFYGLLTDTTNNATHYHAAGIRPYWIKGEKPTATIGRHVFYRIV